MVWLSININEYGKKVNHLMSGIDDNIHLEVILWCPKEFIDYV